MITFGRGQESAVRAPRMNVVSVVILVASLVVGVLGTKALAISLPLC